MLNFIPLTLPKLEWVRQLKNKNKSLFFDESEISWHDAKLWFKKCEYRKAFVFYIIESDGVKVGTVSVDNKEKYRLIADVLFEEKPTEKLLIEIMKYVYESYQPPFKIEVDSKNKRLDEFFKKNKFVKRSEILWKV